jgi:hypothetical protein
VRRRPSRSAPPAVRALWRRPVVLLGAAMMGVGGAAAMLPVEPVTGVRIAQISAAPLVGADGAALFAEANLAPGRLVTRCVVIDHRGAAGSVRLAAADLDGDLAPYLSVTVAVGAGGSRESCAGFAGEVTYRGMLTDLADGPAAMPGVPAGWQPAGIAEARTYRITVRVADDNAAQGRTAAATLLWLVVPSSAHVPAPTYVPAPDRSGPATPTTGPPAAPTRSTPAAVPTSPAASAVPSADAPRQTAATSPPAEPGTAGARSGRWPSLRQMVDVASRIAAQAGRHAVIPLLAFLLALVFLAVQDRIDRRDPKLMLAPLSRDRLLATGDHSVAELTDDDDQ